MSRSLPKQYLPHVKLNSTAIGLPTYTAEPMKVLGETMVQVKYGDYKGTLKLYAVDRAGPNLIGFNWLQHVCLDWKSPGEATVKSQPRSLSDILNKHKEVFQDELGTMKDFTAKLSVRSYVKPKF